MAMQYKQLHESVLDALSDNDFKLAEKLMRDQPCNYRISELKGSIVFRAAAQDRLNDVIDVIRSLADDRQPLCWLHSTIHPTNNYAPECKVIWDFLKTYVESKDFLESRKISRSAAITYALYAEVPDSGFADLEKQIPELCSEDYIHIFSFPPLHRLLTEGFGESMMQTPAGIVATLQMCHETHIDPIYRDAARSRIDTQLWNRLSAGDLSSENHPLTPDYNSFAYYVLHKYGASAAKVLGLTDRYLEYQMHFPKPSRVTRLGDPKIAICVPGQLRGYKEAFSSWSSLRALPHAEWFVSTWENIGARHLQPGHASRLLSGHLLEVYTEIGKASQSHVNEYIPNFINLFLQGSRVNRKELCDLYETENVVVEEEPSDWGAMQKMYYKHAQIIARLEGFDYIIRVRPDKAIYNASHDAVMKAVYRGIAEREILVDWLPSMHFAVGFGCGDQIMMGPADLVRQCSNVYGENRYFYKQNVIATKISDQFSPHSSLAAQIVARNIKVGPAPFAETSLLNAPLPSLEAMRQALMTDAATSKNSVAENLLRAVELDLRQARKLD